MRNFEVHQELSLLGVSPEVHALVDDLDLDFGVCPLYRRKLLDSRLPYRKPICRVYVPYYDLPTVQGRLF